MNEYYTINKTLIDFKTISNCDIVEWTNQIGDDVIIDPSRTFFNERLCFLINNISFSLKICYSQVKRKGLQWSWRISGWLSNARATSMHGTVRWLMVNAGKDGLAVFQKNVSLVVKIYSPVKFHCPAFLQKFFPMKLNLSQYLIWPKILNFFPAPGFDVVFLYILFSSHRICWHSGVSFTRGVAKGTLW